MKQLSRLEQMGATPGKLALVAVLAMVLVFVIVRAIPGSNQQANNKPKPKAAETREKPIQQVQQSSGEEPKQAAPWPQIEMTEMLASDPFATPSWAVKPEEAQKAVAGTDAGKLAELQKQGTTLVMITSESKSASIGDRHVHVGDILEGYQITDITAQGIVLHKLSSR